MMDRQCQHCGASINGLHGKAKFCGKSCRLRNMYGGPIPGDTIQCAYCSRSFVKARNETHCSNSCREAHNKSRRRERRGHRPRYMNGPPTPKHCAQCGVTFSAFDPKRKYCAPKGACAQKAYRASETGISYFARQDVQERIRESAAKYAHSEHGREMGAMRKRRAKRTKSAKRHMQEALQAVPSILAMIQQLEVTNEKRIDA